LQLAAAQAGLGLIHGFEGFIAPVVAAGNLEFVLEDWSEHFPGPFLYYASRRNMPGPLRAFVDFLKSEQVPLA
jgi:DNA-binding transcriptional LysR family regulator